MLHSLAFAWLAVIGLSAPGHAANHSCQSDSGSGTYRCHDNPDKDHFLVGLNLSSNLWLYDNGPANLFAGGGVAVEYGYRFAALYADYNWQPHLTGDRTYALTGWSAGLKLGPSINQDSWHPYLTVGGFHQSLRGRNGLDQTLYAYQFGAGMIVNVRRFAIDARVLYRNPNEADSLWRTYQADGLQHHLGIELIGYLRF